MLYLRSLKIKRLKLVESLELDFTVATRPGVSSSDRDRRLRKWTGIIGENGTGKTAILQAIALAAVGVRQVNLLGEKVSPYLRDRRADKELSIEAVFLQLAGSAAPLDRSQFGLRPTSEAQLVESTVKQWSKESDLLASSKWVDPIPVGEAWPIADPIDVVRARDYPGWFVAAYGIARTLPFATDDLHLVKPSIDRLRTLFDPRLKVTSTNFTTLFQNKPDKLERFTNALRAALFNSQQLLPGIKELILRGEGGGDADGGPNERNRFVQGSADASINLPLNSLSHGYQSTVAWIADLIGHYTLEATDDFTPETMRGLVLIDELDLYLHPTWQVVLVRALKHTFPQMQFIFTTHSPLVLAALDPKEDQIVRLTRNATTGSIDATLSDDDPRTLTGTELLKRYFGVDDIHPDEAGRALREYRYLAANPYRTKADESAMADYLRTLRREGIDPGTKPVPRAKRTTR